jgi:hypothetical protein
MGSSMFLQVHSPAARIHSDGKIDDTLQSL